MSSKYNKNTPYVPTAKYHLSQGNSKIGKILNTNLLAGDDDINGRVAIKGSCCGCCSSCMHVCYARAAYRYDSVIIANADNTYFARVNPTRYFDTVVETLNKSKTKYHRWHSSGEILSPQYIEGMVDVANRSKDKQHYVYTKRYDWINSYLNSNTKPVNLSILFSPPFTCNTLDSIVSWSKQNNPHHLPMFIYDAGNDPKISKIPHCPAVDKKGHKTGITCDQCKRCIQGYTTAVYAH